MQIVYLNLVHISLWSSSIMKTGVFVFILLAFLSETLNIASADLDKDLRLRSQCGGYCFSVFTPVLDHFVELKEASKAANELNLKVISLQNQLAIAEDQIKNKIELIAQKDEQIKDKIELITQKEEQIKDKMVIITQKDQQIKDNIELITQKDEQIKEKNAQIRDKDELLSTKNNEIQVQSEQKKNKEDEINSLRNQTKLISEELSTTKKRLSDLTQIDLCPIVDKEAISKIYVRGLVFEAPCTKDGWMIIQKRFDGSVNFSRNWEDYKHGFGDVHGEFFIGLEKLHLITQAKTYELRIELGDVNGRTGYAYYDDFEIGSEEESYSLKSIRNYSGTAGGDSLDRDKGMKFTTFDRDNDLYFRNCATIYDGGWWFNKCGFSGLNGKYFKDGRAEKANGIKWGHFQNFDSTNSLTSARMMIKPKLL